jgi:uncharacterized membrane protein YgcG
VTPHSPHTTHTASAFAALITLLAAGFAALSLTGTAAAASATPCGKKVLADWYDNGRIDRLYPLHCYEEAVDAIPPDIRDYVDARDVIERALQAAVNGKLTYGGPDPTPGDGNGNDRGIGGLGGGGGGSNGNGGSGGGGTEVTPDVNTSSPSSVPIPLLILGGMSLALLAAGGLGYVSRRRQAAHADGLDDSSSDDDTLG